MSMEWHEGDRATLEPRSTWPSRFANTTVAVISTDGCLLLINPHPESWNNWQLPYVADTTDLPPQTGEPTMETLEALAQSYVRTGQHDDAARGIAQQVGVQEATVAKWPSLVTFAYRYSQTAKVWTLYRFAYHATSFAGPLEASLQHTKLDLNNLASDAMDTYELEGLSLSDNIKSILASADYTARLKSALTESQRIG